MKFIEFPSLSNVSSASALSRVQKLGLDSHKRLWMATEKIHGANFGIYSDGVNVKSARRTGFNEDADPNFFDSRRVVDELKDAINHISANVINSVKGIVSKLTGNDLVGDVYAITFGELFGGSIQKNMPYPDKQDFCVFDFVVVIDGANLKLIEHVFLKGADKDTNGVCVMEDGTILLAPSNKVAMLEDFASKGLITAPILKVGTLQECLDVSNDFESKFTDNAKVNNLKLPTQADRDLRCKSEGVVIEPLEGLYNQKGRIYLKNRSEKFEEKKSEPKRDVTQMVMDNLSPKALYVFNEIESRLCENRVNSVLSKHGEVTLKDFNKIAQEHLLDAIADFEKDELYDVDTDTVGTIKGYLDKVELKAVYKIAYNESCKVVRPILVAI